MGRAKEGILGAFSGKIGPVVGVITENGMYLRSSPRQRTHFSPAEIDNQLKFKVVQKALHPLKDFLRIGFYKYYTKSGGIKGAFSYNRKFAVSGSGPDFLINPEAFKVTGGDLPNASMAAVLREGPDAIRFTWDPAVPAGAHKKDQVMLAGIHFETNDVATVIAGTFRHTGTELMQLPPALIGKDVDVYIGFVSWNRDCQSDSLYLGKV